MSLELSNYRSIVWVNVIKHANQLVLLMRDIPFWLFNKNDMLMVMGKSLRRSLACKAHQHENKARHNRNALWRKVGYQYYRRSAEVRAVVVKGQVNISTPPLSRRNKFNNLSGENTTCGEVERGRQGNRGWLPKWSPHTTTERVETMLKNQLPNQIQEQPDKESFQRVRLKAKQLAAANISHADKWSSRPTRLREV